MLYLQIDKLQHRWCHLVITDGVQTTDLYPSSIGDSLEALVQSASSALDGGRYTATFFLEPDAIRYTVEACEEGICLAVGNCNYITSPQRYARQILSAFTGLLLEDTQEGYCHKWGHAFPRDALNHLSHRLKQYKESTKKTGETT